MLFAPALAARPLRSELALLGIDDEAGDVALAECSLHACHSGAIADGTPFEVDARVLRTALAGANITVLTSSQGEEYSRERESWNNGAFTEAFLDALSSRADTNRNGMISVNELVAHLDDHVPRMTEGEQNPEREVRYGGDLFVAGL